MAAVVSQDAIVMQGLWDNHYAGQNLTGQLDKVKKRIKWQD